MAPTLANMTTLDADTKKMYQTWFAERAAQGAVPARNRTDAPSQEEVLEEIAVTTEQIVSPPWPTGGRPF